MLSWWPKATDDFLVPEDSEDEAALKRAIHRLQDGSTLSCRGRDWYHKHAPKSLTDPCTKECKTGFEEWDYGYLVKRKKRLFFLYQTGDIESFSIDSLQLRRLVNTGKKMAQSILHPPLDCDEISQKNVCTISHGFSEEDGPTTL